ncbi:MAG: peptidoglycan DD-metalloendopeptidase family protein [Rhodospirillaceae bacterium]
MGVSHPGTAAYAFFGALIGAVVTYFNPVGPAFLAVDSRWTSESLAAIAEEFVPPAPAPELWLESLPAILRDGVDIETVKLRAGDTLQDVLLRAGLDTSTASSISNALYTVFNPKRLRAGQELELEYDAIVVEGETPLAKVALEINPGHKVSVARQEDGSYAAREIHVPTRREFVRAEGTIESSLFEAAAAQGVPQDVMAAMVKLFSYDVDFQRDIQKGDRFSVLFERTVTDDGRTVNNLDVAYAALNVGGQTLKLYAFEHPDGGLEYYNERGEGIRKALMRTPINGAKLTSSFGKRRHPILGYSLMHRGSDFGAPTGTPIMAAGDGVIEKAGPNGAYGNYIRIRHSGDFQTAYAHLSRFGAGVSAGKRVRQGQIIGYVGTTGRSTGPHLHFEILRKNAQVNPATVKLAGSQRLEGKTLAAFKSAMAATDRKYATVNTIEQFAMLRADGKQLAAQ